MMQSTAKEGVPSYDSVHTVVRFKPFNYSFMRRLEEHPPHHVVCNFHKNGDAWLLYSETPPSLSSAEILQLEEEPVPSNHTKRDEKGVVLNPEKSVILRILDDTIGKKEAFVKTVSTQTISVLQVQHEALDPTFYECDRDDPSFKCVLKAFMAGEEKVMPVQARALFIGTPARVLAGYIKAWFVRNESDKIKRCVDRIRAHIRAYPFRVARTIAAARSAPTLKRAKTVA